MTMTVQSKAAAEALGMQRKPKPVAITASKMFVVLAFSPGPVEASLARRSACRGVGKTLRSTPNAVPARTSANQATDNRVGT